MGAKGKSKLPLLIGLGAVVVAGAVIAIVLVMRGGKGGAGSRDDVVNDTIAAIAAGDGDKLIKLGATSHLFTSLLECKDPDKDDSDDDSESKRKKKKKKDDDEDFDPRNPEKMLDKLNKQISRYAESTKGTQIEIVEIETAQMPALEADDKDSDKDKDKDKDDEDKDKEKEKRRKRHDSDDDSHVHVTKKGEKLFDGCKSKKTFQSQTVSVRVKITEPDHDPEKTKIEVNVTELDGRYYLTYPPRFPLVAAGVKMAGFYRDDMCACTDAKCGEKVEKQAFELELIKDKKDKMTKDEKDKLKSIEKEYKACRKKATGKGNGMEEAVVKMTELSDHMCACTDKACADRVQDEMTKWSADMAKDVGKDDKPDPETMKKATDVMQKYSECFAKLLTPTPPPPPPPPPPQPVIDFQAAPADMPQLCQDMRAELARVAACDKFPASAKDSLRQSWDALVTAWGSTPASGRKAMEDACKSSLDAIKQSASTLCP